MSFQINGTPVMFSGNTKLYDNGYKFRNYMGTSVVRNTSQATNLYSASAYATNFNYIGNYSLAFCDSRYTYWSPIVGGNREFGSDLYTIRYTNGLSQPIIWGTAGGSTGTSQTGLSGTYEHMCTRSAYYGYRVLALYQRVA